MEIRTVQHSDKSAWFELDAHLARGRFEEIVRTETGLALFEGSVLIGLLRFSYFWQSIPFLDLLMINEEYRRQGYGQALMKHWQEIMRKKGCDLVMTSTRADESAQHFYRALGYQDCGGLLLNFPGYAQPMELFLARTL